MKAEAAKLPGAGTSPKQWLKKMRAEKGWLTGLDESRYDGRTRSTCEMKKGRECTRECCPLEEQYRSERATVSHRWDWAISGASSDASNSNRLRLK